MSDGKRIASETLVDFIHEEDTVAIPESEWAHPEAFDVWVVDTVLARGQDATVYVCHNLHAPRIRAALKTPSVMQASDPALMSQFVTEARILARLDHPHIVAVRNVRLDHHPPFLEMPYLEGPTLQAKLADGPLAPDERKVAAETLCSAVAHLLEKGIHHRDIKPANVIWGDAGPVLIDFGLSTTSEQAATVPLDGVQGTPGYLPPEWSPDAIVPGGDWDRYALGVVLYECCVGRPAFPIDPAQTRMEQVYAAQKATRNVECLDPGPDVPEALRSLVMALTHRDVRRRQVALGGAVAPPMSEPVTGAARPVPAAGVPVEAGTQTLEWLETPPPRVRPLPVVLGIGVVGLACGALAWTLYQPAPESSGRVQARLALDLVPASSARSASVSLDGTPVALRPPPPITPGAHTLRVRVGRDCGEAKLPIWCAEQSETIQVAGGSSEHVLHTMTVPEMTPQELTVDVSGGRPTRARVGDDPWVSCEKSCVLESLPGPQQVVVVQGAGCPDTPCGDTCPSGCGEASSVVDVPFASADGLRVSVVLPQVEISRAAPRGETVSAPEASGLGPAISVGAFQAFVRARPEYAPGGSMALQKADAKYLPGWKGDVPMNRFTNQPLPAGALVDGVSPAVVEVYCASRGGVARVEDGPVRLEGRAYELRRDGASWVALDAAGQARPVTSETASLRHFTVRCRR